LPGSNAPAAPAASSYSAPATQAEFSLNGSTSAASVATGNPWSQLAGSQQMKVRTRTGAFAGGNRMESNCVFPSFYRHGMSGDGFLMMHCFVDTIL